MLPFNINSWVKVKLTKYGESIITEQVNELNEARRKRGIEGNIERVIKRDENGYSKFQMYDLMSTFGSYMGITQELPFEVEILIEGDLHENQESNLFSIEVKDMDSLPVIKYRGKKIEGLREVEYNWSTRTADEPGKERFSLEYIDKQEDKRPKIKRVEYEVERP